MRDTFDPRDITRRPGQMGLPKWAGPVAIAILVAVVASTAVVQIPAGHVGVVTLFGSVSERALESGLHLVNPLARVIRMDIRTNEVKEVAQVPSKEGLSVGTEISVLFRLENAPEVYRLIGPTYVQRVVEPQVRSELRGVTARYEARALYTVDRALIEQEIAKELEPKLAARGLRLEAVLLRDVRLPEQVRQAIEAKAAAEQEAERMRFVLLKERQEAERKKIEAQGIAEFQQVVSKGIDQRLLQWRAIEAVQELAKSENAKFVILGDKSGLPMIINPN